MITVKAEPEYFKFDPSFKPLPKNGDLSEFDPAFAQMKPGLDEAFVPLWDSSLTMEQFKKIWSTGPPPPENTPIEGKDVLTEKIKFPARDGALVDLKVYKSAKVQKDAALVMRFHGGGWVVGGHATEEPESLLIAGLGNVVVVSVDYRMAPEFIFPYAVDDSWDATLWCRKNASTLGVSPEKVIFIGNSAGGNLAAIMALKAKKERWTGVLGQVLNYPALCHPKYFPYDKYELGSYQQNAQASIVTAVKMEWFWDRYLPSPYPDAMHSPLLADSLKGVAPALIQAAGVDPLRDEAIAYAEKLEAEGVPVELHKYKGLPHCFYMLGPIPQTAEHFKAVLDFIAKVTKSP